MITSSVTFTFPIKTINLSPGSHIVINNVSWQEYENLLDEFGETRHHPRINYYHGTLELMAPLPAHERPNRIIAYIVTAILDSQNRDWEDFGSTTFKKSPEVGLEPDTCFYIENAAQVRPNLRINMSIDPPPDLAIESDVTSKTTLKAHAILGFSEVWTYENDQLKIFVLQKKGYSETLNSLIFPDFNLVKIVPTLVKQAFQIGTSQMLREFRRSLVNGFSAN